MTTKNHGNFEEQTPYKEGILNCLQLPTIAYNNLQYSKCIVSISMSSINLINDF